MSVTSPSLDGPIPSGETVDPPTKKAPFRTDIEGLRGIAVLAVVLYHAGVPYFTGGYVGVDIFFVISGFLITGLLVDERARSGTVRLGAFIARRVRRLLPASTVVFVATTVATAFLLTPLQVKGLGSQARAVAVFGSNIWFSIHATDYLKPDVVSPYQQYWSLAVEEQFYLVWPLIVFVVCIGCRSKLFVQRRVLSLLSVLVVVSFGLSVWLTRVRQPSAFFLLHARAWELGVGALLAVAIRLGATLPRRIAAPLGWLGLILMVGPVFIYSDSTAFPGLTALAPVLGTAMVLFCGSGDTAANVPTARGTSAASAHVVDEESGTALGTLLGWRPLREAGKYSYALYLWHWPLLVIAATRDGGQSSALKRVFIVAVACVVSVATYHLVENRVRFAQRLTRSTALSVALLVPLVGISLSTTILLDRAERIEIPSDDQKPGRPPVVEGKRTPYVPEGVTPALGKALEDSAKIYANGCHHSIDQVEDGQILDSSTEPGIECTFGAPEGPVLWLAGDSHAAHWFPALDRLANKNGWRLTSTTKSTCPLVSVGVYIDTLKRDYTECDKWRESVMSAIEADPPSAVILAQISAYYVEHSGQQQWMDGMRTTVERLAKVTDVLVFRDTPKGANPVPSCLTVHLDDVSPCEFGVTAAERQFAAVERKTVESAGGHYIDPVPIVCPDGHCPVIVGNILGFMDEHHLTATYSKSLAEPLGELLGRAWTPK